jgi:hypothetical protein
MKSSNIAQEKTQAPYPDDQDLNGQKLKKKPRNSRFLCKIICQKGRKSCFGERSKEKKKSTMAKEKFSHKKDWFTKELVEKNSQTKTLFWLGRSPHPTVGKIKHFCAYI